MIYTSPNQISQLPNNLTEDVDVIYGVPHKEPHGILRGFASRILKLSLRHVLGSKIARNGAFRAFRTKLRVGFQDYNSTFVSIDVLLMEH